MTPTVGITSPAQTIAARVNDVTVAQHEAGQTNRLAPLADLLKYVDTQDAYSVWLRHPITQAYLSALRELSYLPASSGWLPTSGDASMQYGLTLAFQTAERLLSNPKQIIPSAFSVPAPGEEPVEEAPLSGYSDEPDFIGVL